ncbi:MAG: NUDIX hydrolase [Actinomycetota bacterium]
MYSPQHLRDRLKPTLDAFPQPMVSPDTRLAAVLVPVVAGGVASRVVFTKRTDRLSRHPGEISFPGGLAEEGEDLTAAALREVQEELGLAPSDVELIGVLPPVHTRVSGILIVPFVGLLSKDPRFTPNAAEIADVLELPLAGLASAGAESAFEHEGQMFRTFLYEIDGRVIWGATARILRSLIDILQRGCSDGWEV